MVVNTCTVTENGDQDTRKLVNKISKLNNYCNCPNWMSGSNKTKKLLKLNNVTWVIGNHDKMNLRKIMQKSLDADELEPVVLTTKMTPEPFELSVTSYDRSHTRANLKIQDGCDFYCSFVLSLCAWTSGSRVFDNIIEEARHLVGFGHKEFLRVLI